MLDDVRSPYLNRGRGADNARPALRRPLAVMATDLSPFFAALAELDERTLVTLSAVANDSAEFAPGLLAWIEHACGWELNRRRGGLDFPLLPPEAAIEMIEHALALGAMAGL